MMPLTEFRWKLLLIWYTARRAFEARPSENQCNICGFRGFFEPFGWPVRPTARCPQCRSLERHRAIKAWLDLNPKAFEGRSVLHFAPEKAIRAIIEPHTGSYRSADIVEGLADLTLNIEALSLPDASFDSVICSHVLEHVNDSLALAEIYRVVRPGGFALFMTPIVEGWDKTYENPAIQSIRDRILHFGQGNHVRFYGADFRARIRAAGFTLSEFTSEEPLVSRHSLWRGEKIFVAAR